MANRILLLLILSSRSESNLSSKILGEASGKHTASLYSTDTELGSCPFYCSVMHVHQETVPMQ